MYELIIKILGEKDYKKYTIKDIQEMNRILKDLRTEMVRLKQIEREVIEDNQSLRFNSSTKKTK